jgi:hypothetical protein
MRFGWRPAVPLALLALVSCGGGASDAAAASPQDLQDKMALVQQQFVAEQAVLDKQKDSALDIASGGGAPGAGAPPTLFELLRDPSVLLEEAGDAAEATSVDTLAGAWAAHDDAWCAQDSSHWDDDFFLAYGGAHVLPALVAFIDEYCGPDKAGQLVTAAEAQGLGEGMAASGDPTAGIDLRALLDRLND